MKPEVEKALRESIAHWKAMRGRPGNWRSDSPNTPHAHNCALCKLFGSRCEGCPVYEKTGLLGCVSSPYREAYFAWCNWNNSIDKGDSKRSQMELKREWRVAATAMIEFLEGLLPEGEQ